MKRFAIVFPLLIGLCAASLLSAQDTPAQPDAVQDLGTQLKEKPDDMELFNKYMIKHLGEVRKLMTTEPDKADAILAKMKTLIESLEPNTPPGKQIVGQAVRAIDSYGQQIAIARVTIKELVAKLTENPEDAETLALYNGKLGMEIAPLTRTEPEKAEKILTAAKELVKTLKEKAEEEEAKKAIEQIERSFASLEQRIEMGKKLAALVGADAAPLEIDAWVNGEAITDADLKGKVVLLDFWAVWCGPCIATFPHLIEWHEKYADKGLVIIGLTNYYEMTWNDETGRAQRATGEDEVTPEQEHEMLAKFAEHHKLHHRLAVKKDRTLSEYYAVSGIPHVVVIDREGKVQLIRVGSGEENAKAVESKIKELIAE